MTLSSAFTETEIEYEFKKNNKSLSADFYFEGRKNDQFGTRIFNYLKEISGIIPDLLNFHLTIRSTNSFPHSSGIASSASAMSALALCLTSMFSDESDPDLLQQIQSSMARIGSGSASRSIFPGWVIWGKTGIDKNSSDEFAIPLKTNIHKDFRNLRDSILIVSSERKAVSSSKGHDLMTDHPYREGRLRQADNNLGEIIRAMQNGNWDIFIKVTEKEALSLHGLMMSSNNSYLLLKPGTLEIIQRIKSFREDTHFPVCYTLDAGPNVHLLYPEHRKEELEDFLKQELLKYCQDGQWINDRTGDGPLRLK